MVTLKTSDRGLSACVEIATRGDANLPLHLKLGSLLRPTGRAYSLCPQAMIALALTFFSIAATPRRLSVVRVFGTASGAD